MEELIRSCMHGLFAPVFGPNLSPQQPAESRLQKLTYASRSTRVVLARKPQQGPTSNSTSPKFLNRRRCLAPSAVTWKKPSDRGLLVGGSPPPLCIYRFASIFHFRRLNDFRPLMFPCLLVNITVSQRLPLRTKSQMNVP